MNGSIPMKAKIVASRGQVSCSLEGESVILSLEDGIYYGLNPVASRVWEMVQEPRTVSEICEQLLSEYEIEESSCTRDVMELVQRLHRWKLVVVSEENGASPR